MKSYPAWPWEDDPEWSLLEQMKALAKFTFITISYGFAFASLIQLGFFFASEPSFGSIIVHTGVIDWIEQKLIHGIWWDWTVSALCRNFGLLLVFYVQHTWLSSRALHGTWLWESLHHKFKVDRSLYIFTTGLAIQGIVRFWQPVPVVFWTSEMKLFRDNFHYVHILGWALIYGTCLMMDLPEMVGYNQVTISSPTTVKKSPELQLMYKNQRHLGLIPCLLILLIHPSMTLDRAILTATTVSYMFISWKSSGIYDYVQKMKHRRLL